MPSGIFSECSSSCIIISQIRSSTVIRGCPKPWLNIVVCAVPFFDIFLTFGNRLRGHISPMQLAHNLIHKLKILYSDTRV
jgi:hypothetical protein